MGPVDAARCLLSYLQGTSSPGQCRRRQASFEAWVVRRFGRRLFEMFFKSYSEKLWGIPCDELDADFAAQRIKKFSLGEAIKAPLGLGKQERTRRSSISSPIPLGGTGMVYERMADYVRSRGGQRPPEARPCAASFTTTARVRGLELVDGDVAPFDHVISTMPLTLLVQGPGRRCPADVHAAVDALTFRNTILVYLHVDGSDLFPRSVALRPFARAAARAASRTFATGCRNCTAIARTRSSRSNTGATTRTRSGQTDDGPTHRPGHARDPHHRLDRHAPSARPATSTASAAAIPSTPRGYKQHLQTGRRLSATTFQGLHADRPLRRIQVQQPGPQHPDGPAGGREHCSKRNEHDLWASTPTTSRIRESALISDAGLVSVEA